MNAGKLTERRNRANENRSRFQSNHQSLQIDDQSRIRSLLACQGAANLGFIEHNVLRLYFVAKLFGR